MLVAIIGGVIIGAVAGYFIGPSEFLDISIAGFTLFSNEEKDNDDLDEDIDIDDTPPADPDPVPDIDPPVDIHVFDERLVGKWEIFSLVDIDPHSMDVLGAILEFFEDGTGFEHHATEPILREITWKTDSGRLILMPIDTSVDIKTFDYEVDEDTLFIFYNRNRTSYFEAMRVYETEDP